MSDYRLEELLIGVIAGMLNGLGHVAVGASSPIPGAAALLTWAGSGAWIFHNTNRLNPYQATPERETLLADAERALLPLEALPLPRITHVALDVQLYPHEARAVTTGRYRLENKTAAPIAQLLVQWAPRLALDQLDLAGATVERTWADEIFGHFPHLNVGVLHGTAARRMALLEQGADVFVINHDGIKSKELLAALEA